MARFGRLDDDTQLQYLKPALPVKDQTKVSALLTMEECWNRLSKLYGDEIVNLATVKSNLKAFTPKGSQRWEKIASMFDEVEKAVDQLRVINALDKIKEDHGLVSCIISKLHPAYQEEWDTFYMKSKQQVLQLH